MSAISDLAAIVIDRQDPGPIAAFYEAIGGPAITQAVDDSIYVTTGSAPVR